MVERIGNKPPSKEPPKKTEKAAPAKSAKDVAIEEAKKTIKDVTSKDEVVRMEAIQKLRHPPLEDLTAAKVTLKAAPIQEISWLVKSADDIQYSPELAVFAARIAQGGELRDDPRWLLAKTVELAYSVRADATPEARREINAAVVKVGSRLQEMMRDQAFEGVVNTTFDEALYGSPMGGPLISPEKNVFNEEKPEDETITDPELIRLLREINSKIRTDSTYLLNPRYIEDDIKLLQKTAIYRRVPESQIKDAVATLRNIQRSMTGTAEENLDSRGRELIRYDEIKKWIPEEDRVTDRDFFSFNHLTHDEIAKLRGGEEGANEFFYEFITDIYSMGRTPERPELPQMYKFDEYIDFMKWAHPKNTTYYTQLHDYVWKEMPKHNQIIKNLLYTPGDIKEKLKNLQFLTPADLDHYMKNFKYSQYALSLYDEAVFDLLSERKVKYLNALDSLKQGRGWTESFKRYKELAAKRKAGRLEPPELEIEFQKLQETIDAVGYGVNLWDSDVQNYTELDLQISVLNQELDALKMEGEAISKEDKDRKELLESEIHYKHRTLQRIQTDEDYESEKLRQGQHNNKGLSKLDIDVKERLRLLLKERYPEKEPSEWELNMAVWAARQWEIGSSHIVSISAGMSTRPAYEFKHFAGEVGIDVGKYVMKAPAFEDIQRVLNPELFQDRFSMGDKMGETFHALTDRSLLERKDYKFRNDPKYRRDDERDMDKTQRETREFIRQVEDDTGIPYSEMITQGVFQAGGVFDKTGWRLQIATLEEMRKKYLDMQKNNLLPDNPRLDNQGLGIQFLDFNKDAAGKKEILERMVKRDPSKLYLFLNREFDNILSGKGFSELERHRFRQALSAVQIKTWDTKQPGDNRNWAFRDVDLTKSEHFNLLLKPILKTQGFSDEQASSFLSTLEDAKKKFDAKAEGFAKHDWPFTLSINDVDWSDATMFQTGNIANDRRGRDMYGMSQAMQIWNQMAADPELLCNKDPKETLKKLKEFRTWVNSYTTGGAAENATYELAHAWLEFNKHRHRLIQGVPLLEPVMKVVSELDMRKSWIAKVTGLKIGKGENARYVFGKNIAEGTQNWIKERPHKIAEFISYAQRYTGHNAWEAKDLDKILDEMLSMGIFNSNEDLYHDLRNEMRCGLGYQILGLAWKYWWIAPVAAAIIGGKEAVEEEKKR